MESRKRVTYYVEVLIKKAVRGTCLSYVAGVIASKQ